MLLASISRSALHPILAGISRHWSWLVCSDLYKACLLRYFIRSQEICLDLLTNQVERETAMPVEFLTPEQRSRYGAYTTEPSEAQLASYFYLDDTDRERLATKRGSHHRLGFALQVCTVLFLRPFLVDPTRVPSGAVRHIARQLGIDDDPAPLLAHYAAAWQAREHSREIQHLYGYHDFSEQPQHFRLIRWLYL